MNRQQIERLLENPALRDAEVLETHISWLLLTSDKVYKMKKEVQFSFLDFSTPARRKRYCEHELMLNRRLAPEIYEAVMAVNASGGWLEFGAYRPDSVDYAIRMKRVAKKWEMPRMLKDNRVLAEHMDLLAGQLAAFHRKAKRDKSLFNPIKTLDEFGDIANYAEYLTPYMGTTGADEVLEGVKVVRSFLREHHQRFHDRRVAGFTVDGHGDLHAANIFLENNKPVIFDCIEFNDEFRKVDVLDELAFLCVDLEVYGRQDLVGRFLASYQFKNRTFLTKEDERLFVYYRCYRANVRLKVTAIKINSLPSEANAEKLLNQLQRYREVYLKYVTILQQYNDKTPCFSLRAEAKKNILFENSSRS